MRTPSVRGSAVLAAVLFTAALLVSALPAAPAHAELTYHEILNLNATDHHGQGVCLSTKGGATFNGNWVTIYNCVGHTDQEWRAVTVDSWYFRLVNLKSQKCLGIDYPNLSSHVILRDCSTSDAYDIRWRWWAPFNSGWQQLQNLGSGLCLSTLGGSPANSTPTTIYTCLTHPDQRWFEVP